MKNRRNEKKKKNQDDIASPGYFSQLFKKKSVNGRKRGNKAETQQNLQVEKSQKIWWSQSEVRNASYSLPTRSAPVVTLLHPQPSFH
jgi:hypothetical protein